MRVGTRGGKPTRLFAWKASWTAKSDREERNVSCSGNGWMRGEPLQRLWHIWVHRVLLGFPSHDNVRRVPPQGPTLGFPSHDNVRRRQQQGFAEHMRTTPARTTTISPLRKPKLSRRCRECVHGVDNSPEGQSSENNASGRRRDRTSSSLPSWAATAQGGPGQRSPGPPHPPPGWNAGTLELRGTTNNGKAILCTGGFQLTDQIFGWAPEREHTAQNGKCKLLDVR